MRDAHISAVPIAEHCRESPDAHWVEGVVSATESPEVGIRGGNCSGGASRNVVICPVSTAVNCQLQAKALIQPRPVLSDRSVTKKLLVITWPK